MHHASDLLLTLFIIFVAAQVGAELTQRLRMPAVVGEIAAGSVIGPSMMGWVTLHQIAVGQPLDALAEIGVVLLLFAVGLETRLDDLKKVGKSAVMVGILGVVVPFIAGTLWAHGAGFAWAKSMFIAAAFVATSAGITARVLQELGVLQHTVSRVILGAAVIDDILAMLLLGVVSSMQGGGVVDVGSLTVTLGSAIGFLALFGWAGTQMARKRSHWLEKPISPHSPLTIVLALCLGLAYLSSQIGLAAIIGAFLAGTIASETKQRAMLEKRTRPLLALLTPFFFVVTGAKVNLHALASREALWMLLVVTLIAIAAKLAGGFLGALALGRRRAAIVGFGMVPRGEVGVVIAALGLAAGVFSEQLYAVIVAMSLLTAVVTPPVLSLLLKRDGQAGDAADRAPQEASATTNPADR